MSVIVSKDESRTIIVGANERYVINQDSDKNIELSIGTMRPERLSNELQAKLSIPTGTKTQEKDKIVATTPEIMIWPIPLNVLMDIQERTNGDIRIEDVADYNKKTKPGEEFFIRIDGYILFTG
jgi:hypothetical protein